MFVGSSAEIFTASNSAITNGKKGANICTSIEAAPIATASPITVHPILPTSPFRSINAIAEQSIARIAVAIIAHRVKIQNVP
jgi:hypothetical protein